jgi:flavin-dependent dehydrogenase
MKSCCGRGYEYTAAGSTPVLSNDTHDVLILGAGPAGCAAATVLAEHGRRVLLVEREEFPRYRVGESLIPFCWYPLDRLGLTERLDASGFIVHKNSVQFASTDGQVSKPYYYFQHRDHPSSRTWQVVRSDFDQLLLDSALDRGVELLRASAKDLVWEDGSVVGAELELADGTRTTRRARVTIDATGRDGLAMARNRWREQDAQLKKVALWTYYEGALRDPGLDAGATTIAYLPGKGWFWYLPLAHDTVSVGIVAEPDYLYRDTREPAAIFEREVRVQPWIERHLAPGRASGEFRVTRDFSFRSRYCAANGLVLVGDAFAFLDPVFSSGVYFALHSGVLAGDNVHWALDQGDVSAARFECYGRSFRAAIEPMRKLVHAFYDVDFNFGDFLKAHPEHRPGVTDVLIGDLDKDFDAMWRDMAEFVDLPAPLAHGGPFEGAE